MGERCVVKPRQCRTCGKTVETTAKGITAHEAAHAKEARSA